MRKIKIEKSGDTGTRDRSVASGRKRRGRTERRVFIFMRAQSQRSVSAIVPGLPVKTARLLQCLFISAWNTCVHKAVHMHKKPSYSCWYCTSKNLSNKEKKTKKQKQRRQRQRSLLTCVTASPSLGFQLLQNRQRQVYNSGVKVAAVETRGEKKTKQNLLTRWRRKVCSPMPTPPRRGCPVQSSRRTTEPSSPCSAHTAEAREDIQPHGKDTCTEWGKQEGKGVARRKGGTGTE